MARRSSSVVTLAETQVQFEMWPEPIRGMSNALARSALFRVGHPREPRLHLKREHIAALSNYNITYTGEELRQDDHDVFLQIAHLARLQPLGTGVSFTAHSMLTELGWTINSESYDRLRNCIERLKATALTVALSDGTKGYSGSLIRSFKWSDGGRPMQRWEILLEPEILALYSVASWTRVEWKMRLDLPPLAKWLHGFYATHQMPFPYSVTKLHELCGTRTVQIRQFRYKLRKALDILVERGFFTEARIEVRSDLVHVERSQRALIAAEG